MTPIGSGNGGVHAAISKFFSSRLEKTALARFDEVVLLFALRLEDTRTDGRGKTELPADVRRERVPVAAQQNGNAAEKRVRAGERRFERIAELLEDTDGEFRPADGERFDDARKINIFRHDDAEFSRSGIVDLYACTRAVFAPVDAVYHIRNAQNPPALRNDHRFAADPARIGKTARQREAMATSSKYPVSPLSSRS